MKSTVRNEIKKQLAYYYVKLQLEGTFFLESCLISLGAWWNWKQDTLKEAWLLFPYADIRAR